jgi:hypothetical protein
VVTLVVVPVVVDTVVVLTLVVEAVEVLVSVLVLPDVVEDLDVDDVSVVVVSEPDVAEVVMEVVELCVAVSDDRVVLEVSVVVHTGCTNGMSTHHWKFPSASGSTRKTGV